MKRQTVLMLTAVVGMGALVPVWAQREKLRATTPEGMARDLGDDLREARGLLDRVLLQSRGTVRENGGARERETRREGDSDRRRLELLLESSERSARDLERELVRLRGPNNGQILERTRDRQALRDSEFDQIVFSVHRARTAGEEMRIVRQLAVGPWISVGQLRELIKVVDQPRDQEETAFLLYTRLTDPGRFYNIREVFKSPDSWDNVRKRLGVR